MNLPFTHDQFLEVFAAYNGTLLPFAVALWLLTAGALIYLARGGIHRHRVLGILLALHWAWSGIAYHLAFFRTINPAARLFAALFVVEAALFLWRGLARDRLTFASSRAFLGPAGVALVAYAMVYPLAGLLFGLRYPRLPTFGVPCPSTILTAGLLLLAPRREAILLGVIPVLWTVVGGSAAFLLGIRADFLLPLAGVALVARMCMPDRDRDGRSWGKRTGLGGAGG